MLHETTSTFATTIGNSIGIIGCVNWKKNIATMLHRFLAL